MTDPPPGRRLAQLKRISVARLDSVTPRKAGGLAAMEIENVLDLLTHYPRRVVDRTNERHVAALTEGEAALVTATVRRSGARRLKNGRRAAEVVVSDGTASLTLTFFNQAWRANQFEEGDVVAVFGKLALYRGRRQMANPIVDVVGGEQTGRLVPIYPQSEKAAVSSVDLARYVAEALRRSGDFADPLPALLVERLGFVSRSEAMVSIHQPEANKDYEKARHRLAFDELLRLQVLLVKRRMAAAEAANGISHEVEGELVSAYLAGLPFELTKAQTEALKEIRVDLRASYPMNRLMQGEVGAGKTVVALAALVMAVDGGYQGAFMVPTEVLADQHYFSARALLGGLEVRDDERLDGRRPLRVELLTNKTPASERADILSGLAEGSVEIVIGTHALIAEKVAFSRLGVVVVDEQHRFGVEQRALLGEKAAADPDVLVMTATPIPRTAAMTVYGDLDQSLLRELPAGRLETVTSWLRGSEPEQRAWRKMREEVAAGHQGFVVCPLVGGGLSTEEGEEPEDPDYFVEGYEEGRLVSLGEHSAGHRLPRAAVEEHERLSTGALRGLRVGLLHGQMAASQKQEVMAAFRRGELDVLVATTVVEVGVDVANATVMAIEDADRFGIAQLHQLRGRVGRAGHQASCFLLTAKEVSEQAKRRLEALEETTDGFELAETDLALRGGGTILGARQKGRSDLKLANLSTDRELVELARSVATEIVGADPALGGEYELLREEVEALVSEEEATFLFRS